MATLWPSSARGTPLYGLSPVHSSQSVMPKAYLRFQRSSRETRERKLFDRHRHSSLSIGSGCKPSEVIHSHVDGPAVNSRREHLGREVLGRAHAPPRAEGGEGRKSKGGEERVIKKGGQDGQPSLAQVRDRCVHLDGHPKVGDLGHGAALIRDGHLK